MMGEHYYLSTACLHGEHPQCRATCKFCPAECICPCHTQTHVFAWANPEPVNIIREHLNDAVNNRAA